MVAVDFCRTTRELPAFALRKLNTYFMETPVVGLGQVLAAIAVALKKTQYYAETLGSRHRRDHNCHRRRGGSLLTIFSFCWRFIILSRFITI